MQNLIDQQSSSDHNLSDAVAMSGKGVDASVMRDTQRPPTVEPPQALLLPNQPHSSPPNSNSHATPCTTNSAAGGAAARLGTTTGAASTSSPSTTAHFPLHSNNNADIIAMNRRGPFASGLPSYPASPPPPPPPPPYHSSSPASTTHTTTSASMGFDRGGNSPHLLPVAATTAHHVSATLAGISAAPRVVPCFSDGTLSNSLVTHHSTPTHSWAQSVGAAEEPSTLPHLLSREQLPTPQQLFTSLGSSSNISNNNNNTSTTNVAAASTSPAPYLFSSHTSPATAPTTSASPGPTTSSATTATAARQMLSGSQQHPMGIHSHPSSSSGGSGSTRERQPSGVGGGGSGGGSGHTSWLHPSRPAPSLLSASGPTPPPPPPRTMTVQSSGERQFVFASRSRSHTPHQRVLSGSTDGGSSALGGATGGTSTGGGGGGGGGGLGGGSSSGRGRGCSPCSSSTIASLASPSVIHQRRPTQPQFDDVVSSPSTPASAPASAPPVMQLDASASPSRVEPTSTSTTATTAVAAASEMASLPAPLLRAETDYAESEVSPSPTPTEELPRCSLIATRPPQPPASSASNLMDVLAIDGVVAATTPIPLCFSAAAAPSSPSSPTPTLQRTGTTLPIATTTPTPSAPAAGADAAAPLVEHHVDPIANNPSPDGSIEACLERRKKKRPPSLFAQPAATTPIASPPTAASSSPVATVMSSSSGGATPGGATAAATLTAVGSVLPTTTTILSPLEMSLHDSGGLHLLGMKAAGVPSPLASTTTLTIPSELPSVVPSRSGHLGSWARSTSVEIGRPAAGSLTSPPIWSASPSIAPAARRPTAAPPLPLPPSSISTPHPTHRTRRATVRLSRDRRTLVAGIFRVSPSGCLTVRNVLLLNPKGLASYSDLQRINSMGSQRPGSSVLVSPLLCPPSGMLPSREATATANDFLSSHYAPPPPPPPPGARLLQPHLLCSPTTATELEEANDAEGSAYPIFAAGGGSVAGGQHTNYFGGGGGRSIAHGPPGGNRSFALLSASMDTPYSPITYSMDSPFFPSAGPTQGSLGAAGGASTHSRHGYGGGGGGMSSVVVEDGVLRRGVPGSSHDVDASGGGVAMTPVEMVSSSHYSAPKRPRYPLGSPAGGGSDHPTSSQYTNYNNNNNSIFSTRRGGGTFGSAASCNTFGTQIVAAAASPTTHRAVSEVGLGEAPKSLLAYAEIPERDIRLDSVSNTLQFPANAVRYDDLDVKEAVGEGASASVFVALHHPTGRRLAVKRIDLSPLGLDACSLDGQQATPYFMMRSNTGRVAQLQHNVVRELQVLHLTYRSPFMVKVYNAFYRHERAALDIVMEFMHYGSLDHLAKALQAYAAEHPRSTTGMREVPSASSPTTLIHTAAQRRGSPSSPTATSTTTTNNNNNNFFNHFSHTSTNNHLLHLHSNSSMDHNPSGMAVSPLLSRPTSLRILSGLGSTPVSNGGDGFPNMGLPPYRLSAQNLDPYSNNSNSAMSRAVEEVVEESVGVSERLVAVVGEQLLCGVRDMHTRGYIHRDIKPGNVLINEHGIVKLSDFGLSQRCGAGERPMSMESSTTAAHAMMMAEGLTPKLGAMRYGGIHATDSGSGSGITPPFLGMDEMVPRNLHARRPSIGSTALLNDPLQDGMDVLPTACSSSSSSSRSPTSPSHVDDVVEQSPYSGEASASTTQVVMEDGDAPSCITCTPTPHLTRGQRAAKCRPGPLPMAPSAPLRNNDGVSPPPMMMQPEMDGGGGEEEEDDPLMHCSGTNKYMSPERQRGEVHGKPSDIWAVGVSLAEFALGRYPFDLHDCGDDEFERMARMGVAVDVRAFADPPRRVPFSAEFVDFIRLATLPVAADRLTAQELLEHPFFRQWSTPFDLKRYLAERVPVASNKYKTEFFARREAEEQMMMMRGGGSYNASSSCPMTLPGGLCAGAESTELV